MATVSRVLNEPEMVKEATRKQVLDAIKELHYSPNSLGRNLRRMKTGRILVVVSTLSNPFYSRVLRGIEERAREDDYSVVIGTTRGRRDTFEKQMNMLQNREIDGAILMTYELEPKKIIALSRQYPLICACEPFEAGGLSSVCIDDERAARDAVRYLVRRGKRRIALFGVGDLVTSSKLRERGYRVALAEYGIEVDESLIYTEGMTFRAGERAAARLLKDHKEMPDAVFAMADSTAIGAISYFASQGIRVPEQLSVMGFDNTPIAEMYIPPLTTVAQPQKTMGYRATDILIRRINGDKLVRNEIFRHEIIARGSV